MWCEISLNECISDISQIRYQILNLHQTSAIFSSANQTTPWLWLDQNSTIFFNNAPMSQLYVQCLFRNYLRKQQALHRF